MKQGLRHHSATEWSNDCNIRKVTAWREPWGRSLSVSTKLYDQGITGFSHIQTRGTGTLKREKSAGGQWLPMSQVQLNCVFLKSEVHGWPRSPKLSSSARETSILMLGCLFKDRIPKAMLLNSRRLSLRWNSRSQLKSGFQINGNWAFNINMTKLNLKYTNSKELSTVC